jgi:hypothetical protein
MNGTREIETTNAAAKIIITSLYRHGNAFVQCFVLSKIDILILHILSYSRQKRLNTIKLLGTPRGLNNCCRTREAALNSDLRLRGNRLFLYAEVYPVVT